MRGNPNPPDTIAQRERQAIELLKRLEEERKANGNPGSNPSITH